MTGLQTRRLSLYLTLILMAFAGALLVPTATAQNPELQQRLAELKESSAKNKQELAAYTWQEQDTISLKGEVKKQESYQVQTGADGKSVKTPLNPAPAQAQPAESGGRGGRLKQKVVENKKEEYKQYADNMVALVHSYVPPDPAKLQQAFQQGNIKLSPGAAPDQVQMVITNYIKPNDSMTLTIDKAAKALQSIQIGSYMDSPSDAVKFAVQFAKLPEGVNHVSGMTLEGVSKQLKVDVANSNYKKM